jgi:hypothetical protein
MNIKQGSRWVGSDHSKKFIILSEVHLDDEVWIHYRDELGEPPKEYSCYRDSFLSRFTTLPE